MSQGQISKGQGHHVTNFKIYTYRYGTGWQYTLIFEKLLPDPGQCHICLMNNFKIDSWFLKFFIAVILASSFIAL